MIRSIRMTIRPIRQIRWSDRHGAALVLALVMLVILSLMGITAILTSGTGIFIAGNQRMASQTFYIADAALDRAIADHLYELASTSPNWSDTTLVTAAGNITISGGTLLSTSLINRPDENAWLNSSIVCYDGAGCTGWVGFPTASCTTSGCSRYQVRVLRVSNQSKDVYIRARGEQQVGTVTVAKVLVAHLKVLNISPWSSAIFGASGSGSLFAGDVVVHGSVHILGEGATPTTVVLPMSGGAAIVNNYGALPVDIAARIAPQTTLDATLRVKQGQVSISGSSQVGQSSSCTGGKCPMDGVYVTDGITGSAGCSSVWSDNGCLNSYDLGNKVKFPHLKNSAQSGGRDPGTPTVEQDFNFGSFSLVSALILPNSLTSVCDLYAGAGPPPRTGAGSFKSFDSVNLISWDNPTSTLLVSGKISLESVTCPNYNDTGPGGDGSQPTLLIGQSGTPITYSQRGTIFVGTDTNHGGTYPNITVLSELVPRDDPGTNDFPANHALGLITGRQIVVGDVGGGDRVYGAFYAEWRIRIKRADRYVGGFLASTFDVSNVPEFYQVPALSDNVPPGIPAGPPLWIFSIRDIWEVQSPQL